MSQASCILSVSVALFLSIVVLPMQAAAESSAHGTAKVSRSGEEPAVIGKKSAARDAMFQQAMTLYNQGAFAKAASLFRQILALDDRYVEAKVYLARSYYRMNRLDASYQVFTEVNLKDLNAQSAYEYGLTHFAHKQYGKAMEGFALVPSSDPFFDLASLYGAISAYRLKKFDKAADLISKAVVLPNHLIKMRVRYKAYIMDNLASSGDKGLARSSGLKVAFPVASSGAQSQSQFAVDTSASLVPEAPATQPSPSTAPPPPLEQLQSGFTTNTSVGYQNKQQSTTYGARLIKGNLYQAYGSIGGVWNEYFARKEAAFAQPQFSFLTQLDVENLNFDKLDNNPMDDPLTATKMAAIGGVRGSGQVNSAIFSLLPSLTWPVTEASSVSVAMRHTTVLPDFKQVKKATNRSLSLSGQSSVPLGRGALFVDTMQMGDSHDSPLSTEVREMARYTVDLPDNLQFFAGAILSQFQYSRELLDGPDSKYGGFGGVQATFPLNITLGGHLLKQHAVGVRIHDFPNYNVIAFSQDTTTASGYLILRFFPWLTALFTGIEQQRTLSGFDPAESEARAELTQKYPTHLENFELSLRAETSF